MRYAGFWIRAVAYIIDVMLLFFPVGLIHKIFDVPVRAHFYMVNLQNVAARQEFYSSPEVLFSILLSVLTFWVYFAWMQSSSWQATFGMKATGIKIVDYEGKAISFWRATVRFAASYISGVIFFIGYLMIAFTPKKQALHDYIAQTLVLHKN